MSKIKDCVEKIKRLTDEAVLNDKSFYRHNFSDDDRGGDSLEDFIEHIIAFFEKKEISYKASKDFNKPTEIKAVKITQKDPHWEFK